MINMLSIVILFALFLNSGNNNIYAKTKNTITLSSGYLKEKYTNKQIANFGIEFFHLFDYFDKKIDKNTSINILYNLFKLQITTNFTVVYHKLGHALRIRAMGYDYKFIDGLLVKYNHIATVTFSNI